MFTALNDKFIPELPKSGKILDLGAGKGKWSRAFHEMDYSVVAIDVKPRPEDLPEAIEWIELDLAKDSLPSLPEGSFAAVYMRNIIQFLPRETFTAMLLPYAKGLLAKDGILGIETFFGMINPAPGPKPHPAYYTEDELAALCADMDIIWKTQFKADLKDLEEKTREFSISQIVAKKR